MKSPFTSLSSSLDNLIPDIGGPQKMSRGEGKIEHFMQMLRKQPEIVEVMKNTGITSAIEGVEYGFEICEKNGRLVIYNRCIGDECEVSIHSIDEECEVMASFHTHMKDICMMSDEDYLSSVEHETPIELIFGKAIYTNKRFGHTYYWMYLSQDQLDRLRESEIMPYEISKWDMPIPENISPYQIRIYDIEGISNIYGKHGNKLYDEEHIEYIQPNVDYENGTSPCARLRVITKYGSIDHVAALNSRIILDDIRITD